MPESSADLWALQSFMLGSCLEIFQKELSDRVAKISACIRKSFAQVYQGKCLIFCNWCLQLLVDFFIFFSEEQKSVLFGSESGSLSCQDRSVHYGNEDAHEVL